MYRVLISAALVMASVSSFVVQQEKISTNSYFSHPKDRDPSTSPRIIGGEEVEPHSYPFQASLFICKGNEIYLCGGSLISNNLVLTAAHCVDMNPELIIVGLGQHNLSTQQEPEAVAMISTDYVFHEDWESATLVNDVALVRLPSNVIFNEYIQPVQLANGSDKYEGDKGTLIGWGTTELGAISTVLKSVNATIMSNADCANTNILFQQIIQPSHVCTSGVGSVGACSGDSGGPLIVDGVQVGITAFGTTDCTLGLPTGYTRVTDFYDWIAEKGDFAVSD